MKDILLGLWASVCIAATLGWQYTKKWWDKASKSAHCRRSRRGYHPPRRYGTVRVSTTEFGLKFWTGPWRWWLRSRLLR